MSALPADVHDFLVEHFPSVEALEIALLLRRAPDTFWAAPAAAEHLGIRRDVAEARLAALCAARLVVRGDQTGAYRYSPADDEKRRLMDGLADAYTNRRVTVLNVIYSANLERLRAFSGAFRLKDK
jgi:hypothetical protein